MYPARDLLLGGDLERGLHDAVLTASQDHTLIRERSYEGLTEFGRHRARISGLTTSEIIDILKIKEQASLTWR